MGVFTLNNKRRRASALMMKYYSGMIDEGSWKTASSDIAVFNTKYRRNLKSLIVQLEPIQAGSGDPSPDNIRPISGWTAATVWRTGKNLFDPASAENEWVNTNNAIVYTASAKSMRVTINASDTITLSNETPSSATNVMLIAFISRNNTVLSRNVVSNGSLFITATAPPGTQYAIAAFYQWNQAVNAQLEIGATATPYVPYTGTAIPASWETEAGTVYGGQIDVISGRLTVDRVLVTVDWTSKSGTVIGAFTRKIFSGPPAVYPPNESYPQICDIAPYKASYTEQSTHFYVNNNATANINIILPTNTNVTTINICYQINAPIEYQLTPQQIQTLIGENVIWSDAGAVSVEYWS